jgi:hypothetical protein
MVRKVSLLALLMAAVAVVAGWPDIVRFARIRQVSAGQSHPEKVPAGGRTVYPQFPWGAQPDGTGDFDSASRGGPSRA